MESQGDCFKFCEGTVVDFTLDGCPGSRYVFSVTGGSVQIIEPNVLYRVTWTDEGQGQIVITQTYSDGFTLTNTVCIEVIERPEALFTVWPLEAGEEISACVNQEILFTNLSQYGEHDIISSVWDFGDGTTSAETNPTHVWSEAGEYVAYRFAEAGSYQIVLHDAVGKELRRVKLTELSGELPVDLSSCGSGTYFIECRNGKALTHVLKVIKK